VAGLGLSLLGLGDRLWLAALGEELTLMGLAEMLGLRDSLLLRAGLQPGCCMPHTTTHPRPAQLASIGALQGTTAPQNFIPA
jgi:hypothetical protein